MKFIEISEKVVASSPRRILLGIDSPWRIVSDHRGTALWKNSISEEVIVTTESWAQVRHRLVRAEQLVLLDEK